MQQKMNLMEEKYEEMKGHLIKLNSMFETEKATSAAKISELMSKLEDQATKIEEQDFNDKVKMNEIEEMQQKIGRMKGTVEGDKKQDLKGFDPKTTPKPQPYDCEYKEFNNWHDLFMAIMVNVDEKWEGIFEAVEAYAGRVIKEKERKEIQTKLDFDEEMMKKLQRLLYLNMLTYTKGDAHAKVVSGGQGNIMETYRYVVHKGKNATIRVVMEKRVKVMNPEPAKDMTEIEAKMTAWKSDIRYLKEMRDEQDLIMLTNDEQMITILITMMPDKMADHLISKYEKGQTTYEEMEETMLEHMSKMDMKDEKKGGRIRQVTTEKGEESQEGSKEEGWQKHYDPSVGEYWICTAIPAAKRQRVEDEEEGKGKGPGTKGFGKAAGKGKGPPGGCHECGEDHFVRDCPTRKLKLEAKGAMKGSYRALQESYGKAKSKGKGKESWIPQRQWGGYNPGFMPTQWSKWRPGQYQGNGQNFGSKGKGKGDEMNWMQGQRLTFPPLGAINQSPECEPCWQQGYEMGGFGGFNEEEFQGFGRDLGAVTKKKNGGMKENAETEKGKRKFEKTSLFDTSIHKATTYVLKKKAVCEVKNSFKILERNDSDEIDNSPAKESEPSSSSSRPVPPGNQMQKNCTKCPCVDDEKGKARNHRKDEDRSDSQGLAKVFEKINKNVQPDKMEAGSTEGRGMNTLTRPKVESGGQISACTEDETKKWKCISIAVDSGACDSVINPDELPAYTDKILETKDSKEGNDFVSASGDPIPNYGELTIPMFTRESTTRAMKFQAAGVAKPLGSVKRMIMAHHRVVFDEDGSYIENKITGEVNALREEDGNFMLDVWVPPPGAISNAIFPRQP